jgi:hypothetical protein
LEAIIPNRSRTSSQKRQKEIARMEKQRDKAAKRAQRKLFREASPDTETSPDTEASLDTADIAPEPLGAEIGQPEKESE